MGVDTLLNDTYASLFAPYIRFPILAISTTCDFEMFSRFLVLDKSAPMRGQWRTQ